MHKSPLIIYKKLINGYLLYPGRQQATYVVFKSLSLFLVFISKSWDVVNRSVCRLGNSFNNR